MKIVTIVLLVLFMQTGFAQKLMVTDLSCEHKLNPMGIDVIPRLSWKLAGGKNLQQSAYSIRVATDKNFSSKNIAWQSKRVTSGESVLQLYGGAALQSGKRYYWQVKVWDANNNESAWSGPSFWETGLLQPQDWKAQWMEPAQLADRHMPALMMRKKFQPAK